MQTLHIHAHSDTHAHTTYTQQHHTHTDTGTLWTQPYMHTPSLMFWGWKDGSALAESLGWVPHIHLTSQNLHELQLHAVFWSTQPLHLHAQTHTPTHTHT